jgi:hypothetical protein
LLGTFEPEGELVLFGTRKPLRSWNPWTANVEPLIDLWRRSRAATSTADARQVWIAPPEWIAQGEPPAADYPPPGRGYDHDAGTAIHGYALGQLIILIALMTVILTFEATVPVGWKLLASGFILWTGIAWAGLFEQRSWAAPTEWWRLAAMGGVGAVMASIGPDLALVGYGMVAVGITSALAFWRCRADLPARA